MKKRGLIDKNSISMLLWKAYVSHLFCVITVTPATKGYEHIRPYCSLCWDIMRMTLFLLYKLLMSQEVQDI